MLKRLGPLARSALDPIISWIAGIPFDQWPQQHRLNGEMRPAMVTDLAWYGFARETEDLIGQLRERFPPGSETFQRMLSVVMPGHSIPPHSDRQEESWLTRIHIPLLTNSAAVFRSDGRDNHLEVGYAYLVDTTEQHSVRNDGQTPRVHLMFDVRRAR